MHPYKQNIDQSKRTTLKTGDIVQFRNGNKYLPKIYKNQLGIIIERYRTLNQFNKKYWNYFATVEVITDNLKGRKRSFCNPQSFLKKISLTPIKPYIRKEAELEKIDEKIKFKKAGKKDSFGTCLQGYVLLKYEELVSIFGEPNKTGSSDGKVDWDFFLNNELLHIYNYKTGPSYGNNNKNIKPQDIDDWHIGGNRNSVLNLLNNYLCQKFKSNRIYVTGA